MKYKNVNSAAVFALKDKIFGKKKCPQEQVVITDPSTGKLVYTPTEIRRVSLDFLMNLLKTQEPEGKYEDIVMNKKELHYQRTLEIIPNNLDELPT